ncbi:MAG: TlyA family RNA methyltransferase [Anaerolineaceae bacterium]
MQKIRLDQHLVNLGLAESRSKAKASIQSGLIKVDGQVVTKPSQLVPSDCSLTVIADLEFVSRGGLKLKAALEVFMIDPAGKVCADVGASTGGFTDCLLQRGAGKVYAIDVGKDELHPSLRTNPAVVVMEKTNARQLHGLPEPVSLISVDVSFISLDFILPVVLGWFRGTPGDVIALVKPQFEAGRELVKKHKGVVRDKAVHAQVLEQVMTFSQKLGYTVVGLIPSPITGSDGNVEFLLWLKTNTTQGSLDIPTTIEQALGAAVE